MQMKDFPASIIRQAIKVSAEAPMGVKNNFIRLVQQLEPEDMWLVSDAELKLKPEKAPMITLVQSTYKKYLYNDSIEIHNEKDDGWLIYFNYMFMYILVAMVYFKFYQKI